MPSVILEHFAEFARRAHEYDWPGQWARIDAEINAELSGAGELESSPSAAGRNPLARQLIARIELHTLASPDAGQADPSCLSVRVTGDVRAPTPSNDIEITVAAPGGAPFSRTVASPGVRGSVAELAGLARATTSTDCAQVTVAGNFRYESLVHVLEGLGDARIRQVTLVTDVAP